MPIALKNNNGSVAVQVEGDMTIMDAAEFKRGLVEAMSETQAEFALDLSQVGEMDSSGFQLLVLMKREADRQHKGFRIASASDSVLSVLELYNMKTYFGL